MTRLGELEREALAGDAEAVAKVVDALRAYREASASLLGRRWRDGAADGATTSSFANRVEEIEEGS